MVEVQGQRERDLVGVQIALGMVEARADKADKVHGKVEAKGTGAVMRVTSIKVKVIEAEASIWVVEEALHEVRDQASIAKEEALASKAVAEAVEAFRAERSIVLRYWKPIRIVFNRALRS